ncbi:hypothetical protein AVEN_46078-1 [Araneus ventricosus]|uniref:Uncharacterized protein n=1 Tax=Araneus ventricosus TaxID=182803 RepID=A0A4Y2RNE3_ARAVE|nr:hypothetical protein AVEN_46078-1 [Araneus ventricosus]
MLVKVYGVDAVSKKCVFEWFKRFRDGKEDVKDEPRSGRPPTSTTSDNIERVRRMLADDRRLSLRMIAEELKISIDSLEENIREPVPNVTFLFNFFIASLNLLTENSADKVWDAETFTVVQCDYGRPNTDSPGPQFAESLQTEWRDLEFFLYF